jgi:hypothetical protein
MVFSLLQRKALKGASFKTKNQLRDAIEAFIRRHNEHAKPLSMAQARSHKDVSFEILLNY